MKTICMNNIFNLMYLEKVKKKIMSHLCSLQGYNNIIVI